MTIFPHNKNNRHRSFVIGIMAAVVVCFVLLGVARAAWEEPSAQPPAGNIYAPLTTGPEKQAKKGNLILDPLYNPYGETPTTDYPLDVRGTRDVFINTFSLSGPGDLTVDTDTLVVSGSGHNVGMGTAMPAGTVKVDIANGTANAGSAASPVTAGPAISINTAGNGYYSAYGSSTADNFASVSGASVSGTGVYGLNQSSGTGFYAYSLSSSALVGIISEPFNPSNVAAAVYGEATGIGAWAGYFQQRVYSDTPVVAGKFVPDRLQMSQVPYTAGWEVRPVAAGMTTMPYLTVYANGYIWTSDYYWTSRVYVTQAEDGAYVTEFDPYGLRFGSSTLYDFNHELSSMIYAGGYVWIGGGDGSGHALVTRINPDPSNPDVTQYRIGTSNVEWTVKDLVYDSATAGGPYIWTANRVNGGQYSITKLKISDGTNTTTAADPNAKCLAYDYDWLCYDNLDNDNSGLIDRNGLCTFAAGDQAACTALDASNTWTNGVCSDTTLTDQPTCTGAGQNWASPTCSRTLNSTDCATAGGTFVAADPDCSYPRTIESSSPYNPATDPNQLNNEKEHIRPFGNPGGIVLDSVTSGGPYLWLSFGLNNVNDAHTWGEGILRVKISDLTQAPFCLGPGRQYGDIAFDPADDQLWLAHSVNNDHVPYTYDGISKVNAVTGQVIAEYVHSVYPEMYAVDKIKYDFMSNGGPYIWAGTSGYYNRLNKFRISDSSIAHTYTPAGSVYDFTFDRTSTGGPYVWSALGTGGSLGRSLIDSPYTTTIFPIKGSIRSDALFDGTYVWTANPGSDTVSRYLPSDSSRVSEINVGGDPQYIVNAGAYMWAINSNSTLSKIDPTTNGVTDYAASFSTGSDAVYDGVNVWTAENYGNKLYRIRLSSCTGAGGSTCADSQTFSGLTDAQGGTMYPLKIIFDGTYLWVTQRTNRISKILFNPSTNTITVLATYTVNEIDPSPDYNMNSLLYDGSYLWIGANKNDASGNSIFQVDPSASAGTNAAVVRKIKVYHEPGQCGSSGHTTCFNDADCVGTGFTCNNTSSLNGSYSRVQQLMFDGTYIWVASNYASDHNMPRACFDEKDNDGDGKIDRQSGNADPGCASGDYWDISEVDPGSVPECSDHTDNDGNGKCDFDGAAGWPGCSGAPDPGCSSASDDAEATASNDEFVTRILAATGQVIDSSPIGHYCSVNSLVFDGTNVWTAGTGCDERYSLHQIYSGSGLGTVDLTGSVMLRQNKTVGSIGQQAGNFTVGGNGTVGADLLVVGDVVVSANTWGGSDSVKTFGTGCDNGQFIKGVDLTAGTVICRQL